MIGLPVYVSPLEHDAFPITSAKMVLRYEIYYQIPDVFFISFMISIISLTLFPQEAISKWPLKRRYLYTYANSPFRASSLPFGHQFLANRPEYCK